MVILAPGGLDARLRRAVSMIRTDAERATAELAAVRKGARKLGDADLASSCIFAMHTAAVLRGQSSRALRLLRILTREQPLARNWHLLGLALASKGRQGEARAAFARALEMPDPSGRFHSLSAARISSPGPA